MTSNHHAPYVQGYRRATMAGIIRCNEVEQISKIGPSSDWSLQLDSMKLESLVILNQNVRVNTFPGVVHTARHAMRVCNTRSW